MARLIILFIITFLVYVALRGLLAKKNLSVKQFFAIYVATLAGLLLLYLGFTGRLHPVAAIVGAALPFLTRVMSLVTRGAQFAAMFRFLKNMGLGRERRQRAPQTRLTPVKSDLVTYTWCFSMIPG